jgi:hypothetical protein
MQKTIAARNGTVIETFAPTVRHTTFKLLAARGCVSGRRARQFDVEGAYLKGKFEDNEVIYARTERRRTFPAARGTASSTTAACLSFGASKCPCTARPTPGAFGTARR